ncbi:major facilitator superfamily domain-containing protein [Spinellus fusiger]|nr:major facilitator superfamily domain-containing protein [Spinellus fusiger]
MWITFSPSLYDFVDYYFHTTSNTTVNAISVLSSVYMFVYPLVVPLAFPYFEDYKTPLGSVPGNGLGRGVLIGAVLNAMGAWIRWLGNSPSPMGFGCVLVGQTVAALAQVFMLSIPPRLAVAWFPKNEMNLATSIAVAANGLGIAVGCAWTPMAVHKDTMDTDVPHLLFLQVIIIIIIKKKKRFHSGEISSLLIHSICLMCMFVLLFVWISFRETPFYSHRAVIGMSPVSLWRQKTFVYLAIAYAIIMGAQCAIITLLAQIILSPFQGRVDMRYVGLLGSMMLLVGVISSIAVGYCLDRTRNYRSVCNRLFFFTCLSVVGLGLAIEFTSILGMVISCASFGIFSYAIVPAIFQYASELFYPVNEIIPTGYLFTVGNIAGVLFVSLMGWSQNEEDSFTMRLPMLCLSGSLFVGATLMTRVAGPMKRSSALTF